MFPFICNIMYSPLDHFCRMQPWGGRSIIKQIRKHIVLSPFAKLPGLLDVAIPGILQWLYDHFPPWLFNNWCDDSLISSPCSLEISGLVRCCHGWIQYHQDSLNPRILVIPVERCECCMRVQEHACIIESITVFHKKAHDAAKISHHVLSP